MGDNINFNDYVEAKVSKDKNKIDFKFKGIALFIGLLVFLVLFNMFTYRIREDEVAVLKSLGVIKKVMVADVGIATQQQDIKMKAELEDGRKESTFQNVEIVSKKGLGFKIPILHTVETKTGKLLTYVSQEELINTREKRQFEISMYAQWYISHPGIFGATFKNTDAANLTLDNLIYPVIIKGINRLSADEFLNNKTALNRSLDVALSELNGIVAEYGITVKDIEIFRTLLPESNIQSTYSKMRADREAVAQEIRATSQEAYNKRVADADYEAVQLEAESIQESQKIYGEADAEALRIYAEAFNKDPNFYEFWRTMEAYRNSIDKDTTVVIDKNNPFLKYFGR